MVLPRACILDAGHGHLTGLGLSGNTCPKNLDAPSLQKHRCVNLPALKIHHRLLVSILIGSSEVNFF